MVMYATAQTLAVVAVVTIKVTEKDFRGESRAWHVCVRVSTRRQSEAVLRCTSNEFPVKWCVTAIHDGAW